MPNLTFWLHMNDKYMWRWFCYDDAGQLFAISAQSFFDLAEAERAMKIAKLGLGHAALAA